MKNGKDDFYYYFSRIFIFNSNAVIGDKCLLDNCMNFLHLLTMTICSIQNLILCQQNYYQMCTKENSIIKIFTLNFYSVYGSFHKKLHMFMQLHAWNL